MRIMLIQWHLFLSSATISQNTDTVCMRFIAAHTAVNRKEHRMDPRIKKIEDLSLNAWPSHQIEYYDGWLLRFSYFYTHRTNCVEQLGPSTIPADEKIRHVEDTYRRWGTPSIFKISPLVDPAFDELLASRHYQIEHSNDNMILDFDNDDIPAAAGINSGFAADTAVDTLQSVNDSAPARKLHDGLRLETGMFIPPAWIEALFALKGTTNVMHRQVVPSMYQAIPKETICVDIRDRDKRIIGTGLGILDRDYVGVYAIHVHPDFRRKHLGKIIVSTILSEGRRRGACHAYLQVVCGNEPAASLYRSLGFHRLYTDYFRVLRNI